MRHRLPPPKILSPAILETLRLHDSMPVTIPVTTANGSYPIHVGGDLLSSVGEIVAKSIAGKRVAVITDRNVQSLYGEALEKSLKASGMTATSVAVAPGESSKSFAALEEVCDALISQGLDRSSAVVALGGGVVGDLAGFAAAVYFRGIPVVQIPTSIVAQVDSAIGGKTGINSRLGKNLIGAFHQPEAVIVDTQLLKTLPARERHEGFAEIIKHAIIRDAEMLDALDCGTDAEWESLIARNVRIKAEIVSEDAFETKGLRALLNFGHTVGHGIENAAGYGKLFHGEAISMGIVAACRISEKKAGLPAEATAKVVERLKHFELPVTLPEEITTDAILSAMRHDKKFAEGKIRFVLSKSLGSAFLSSDVMLDDIIAAIEGLR